MTEQVRVKVICGQCSRLLGRIIDADDGRTFHRVPLGKSASADTFSPQLVFCPDHGWADLDDPGLAAKLAASRATGTVKTHRARVARVRPIPVKPLD